RLSHFLPFGMQNYAFGLTGIGFWTYAITTWAITLPGTFLQAYIGDLGFSSMESWQGTAAADWQVWGLRGLGLLAVASAVLYIGHLGRSVYREAVADELERAVEEETAADERPHWSWPTLSLSVGGVLIAGLAAWSVIE